MKPGGLSWKKSLRLAAAARLGRKVAVVSRLFFLRVEKCVHDSLHLFGQETPELADGDLDSR